MTMDTTTIRTKNWQHLRNTIGDVALDVDDIKQCIVTICTTQKGSVPFAPEFGCDIMEAMDEEPADAIEKLSVIYQKELPKQEPRIDIISISGDFNDDGRVKVKIYFKEKNKNVGDKVEFYVR